MERTFKKEQLYRLLEKLSDEFEVIGPKELPNKGIFYRQLSGAGDLYLGPGFTTEPVKKFFLEPSTGLFRHSSNDNEYSMETIPSSDKKRIIIGVRSCEARGLVLLDRVFDSEYKDEFYINNRNRTVIVGLACSRPDRNCFCVSMGGSPVESRGIDVLLFEANGGIISEIVTDKGKQLFGSLGEELSGEQRRVLEADKEARKVRLETKIRVPESLDKIFGSDYWLEVSRACISCGICTYLCPTCHCFDLIDEERRRLRCYDGCAFPDFTLEASGENPRPTKKERYRQRVFHKFDYFKRNFGENLCVGCGRCIRFCPVKIDIADIVHRVPLSS
jgi:ferredoxin